VSDKLKDIISERVRRVKAIQEIRGTACFQVVIMRIYEIVGGAEFFNFAALVCQ